MHKIVIAVMAVFALAGGVDRILGNRMGLGERFEEGILAMGPLALSMLGMICLAPVLSDLLRPVLVPVYGALGADPAMFAGTILACDMGGGALAAELSSDPAAAALGGIITASMLGTTVSFTVPATMGILQPEDRPAMAKGILCGVMTVPVGILAGGLTAGIPVLTVLKNMIPTLLIAGLIALGLWKAEKAMVKGFGIFGKLVVAVITVGLTVAILQTLTGVTVISGLTPLSDGFMIVGEIAIVLAGAFPLVTLITRLLQKPLSRVGARLGMNDVAVAGLLSSMANSIATFGMVKDMDPRGKVVNIAFSVSAAFVFGDHLGFTAGFAPAYLPAMIVGKLAGGVAAVAVALMLTKNMQEKTPCAEN